MVRHALESARSSDLCRYLFSCTTRELVLGRASAGHRIHHVPCCSTPTDRCSLVPGSRTGQAQTQTHHGVEAEAHASHAASPTTEHIRTDVSGCCSWNADCVQIVMVKKTQEGANRVCARGREGGWQMKSSDRKRSRREGREAARGALVSRAPDCPDCWRLRRNSRCTNDRRRSPSDRWRLAFSDDHSSA